jgi:cephalosporin hydroxylase
MTDFSFSLSGQVLTLKDGTELTLDDPRAFSIISEAWIRAGWSAKYVYGFSWMGRPIIQLPEDMIRIQEVIYAIKPDVIVETGIAHGGSLIFYASICAAIGRGRVIGIDLEIRPSNRQAIEQHRLSPMISLIEGNSTDAATVRAVRGQVGVTETVLVILDSNHQKSHVLAELEAYSSLVSPGSYIVACDGVMQQVAGAPRSAKDWVWNNPITAVNEFTAKHPEFECVEPIWPFNEGLITERVTYWPKAFLRKKP